MPSVLGEIKFTFTATNETLGFTPLRELLLVREKAKIEETTASYSGPEDTGDEGPVVRTRKASRRAIKSRTAPQNFTSPNSQSQQASILQAHIDRIQALNNDVLNTSSPSFGTVPQNAQNSTTPIEPPPPTFPSNAFAGPIFPTVIAISGFTPIVDAGAKSTLNAAYKSLLFKRASRQLSVDMQVGNKQDNIAVNYEMQTLKIAESLRDYINKRTDFLNSLGLRFDHSIERHLSLEFSTSNPPSNSEYLATIIRDFSNAAYYASGEFQDVSDRYSSSADNNSFEQLTPAVEDSMRGTLAYKDFHTTFMRNFSLNGTVRTNSYKIMRDRRPDSLRLAIRFLSLLIGKETSASFNIAKYPKFFTSDQPTPPASQISSVVADLIPNTSAFLNSAGPDSVSRAIERLNQSANFGPTVSVPNPLIAAQGKFLPNSIFNIDDPLTKTIRMSREGDPESRFVSTVFRQRVRDGSAEFTTVNYPFETTKSRSRSQKTSYDFVTELINPYLPNDRQRDIAYADKSGGIHSNPFSAFANSANSACATTKQVFERVPDETEFENPFVGILEMLADGFLEADNRPGDLIQLDMLRLAYSNDTFARRLLIFLAFLQEANEKYDGVGKAPDGPSFLVRNDSFLKNDVALGVSTGTTTKTQTLFPQNISIDPALESGSSSLTSTTAPPVETTVTVESQASELDAGTLQSVFGVSQREVVQATATMFMDLVRDNYRQSFEKFFPNGGTKRIGRRQQVVRALRNVKPNSIFSKLLKYQAKLPGGLDNSFQCFNILGNSHFSKMRKEMIFAGFFELTSAMTSYMFPLFYEGFKSGEGVVAGVGPIVGLEYTRRNDYAARLNLLMEARQGAFTASFTNHFPILSQTRLALRGEHQFLIHFCEEMQKRNAALAQSFEDIQDSLAVKVENEKPLGEYIAEGLVPSLDTARYMSHYNLKMNGSSMYYNGVKTNDPVLSDEVFRFITQTLSSPTPDAWQTSSDTKVIVVGLPCGLLEDIEQVTPVTSALDGQKSPIKPMFDVLIEKVDETNPYIEYDPIRVTFSRQLFFKQPDILNRPEFVAVNRDLDVFDLGGDAFEAFRGMFDQPEKSQLLNEVLLNHYNDFCLKTYFDLQDDLDFNESAFPVNVDRLEEVFNTKIDIPVLNKIDATQIEFLSASNAQFSPTPISLATADFYDPERRCIDLETKSSTNEYQYSLFDYVNTYGTIFDKDYETSKVGSGLIFEKVLCIPFRDSDFSLNTESPAYEDRSSVAATALAAVNQDSPTLCTYRISVSMSGRQLDLMETEGVAAT